MGIYASSRQRVRECGYVGRNGYHTYFTSAYSVPK
jgi:hypothetical protein